MKVKPKDSIAHAIRALLKQAPDGLTATQIAEQIGRLRGTVYAALQQRMGDAYIDRWSPVTSSRTGGRPCGFEAIWCLADVPAHCPHPTRG